MYLLFADIIVVIHALFVLFALFGGLLLLKWKRVVWLHIPAVIWGVSVQFAHLYCPLTPLEIWLRKQAGADLYEGGFISHYLNPLIYPGWLTPTLQWVLGSILLGVNVLVYYWVFRRKRKT